MFACMDIFTHIFFIYTEIFSIFLKYFYFSYVPVLPGKSFSVSQAEVCFKLDDFNNIWICHL